MVDSREKIEEEAIKKYKEEQCEHDKRYAMKWVEKVFIFILTGMAGVFVAKLAQILLLNI